MYSGLASNIVKKFQNCGFGAKQLGSGVTVWLKREISTWEVEDVLTENFTGNYSVKKIAVNQVMIDESFNR